MNELSRYKAAMLCMMATLGPAAEAMAQNTIALQQAASPTAMTDDDGMIEPELAEEISDAPRDVYEIIMSLPPLSESSVPKVNVLFGPHVFSGYRQIGTKHFTPVTPDRDFYNRVLHNMAEKRSLEPFDKELTPAEILAIEAEPVPELPGPTPKILSGDVTPDWLRSALISNRIQNDFLYSMMIDDHSIIDYAYWDLPVPPRLPEDDGSFATYIQKLDLPEVDSSKAKLTASEIEKKHWLHVFNTGLQFSQAYLSQNWYQGGNNNVSLFINFLWDVQLNPVWHNNFLLQSTLSYKLGLNSTPKGDLHNYSISEDLLQYNFKMGLKAAHNWYYSMTTQFKTQLLNNYQSNSNDLKAAFLSSGELNVGLGMTYSKGNKNNTVNFSASIAPLSYNLKMCISDKVNHGQFGIADDKKTVSEIGSSAELNFRANVFKNINYSSRLFLFSDYKYFLGDWENTLSFQFNKFFSTQVYAHIRYDSSIPRVPDVKWNRWMIKEIFSVGLTYTFSTKR